MAQLVAARLLVFPEDFRVCHLYLRVAMLLQLSLITKCGQEPGLICKMNGTLARVGQIEKRWACATGLPIVYYVVSNLYVTNYPVQFCKVGADEYAG
jgi:hypothetical protein